MENTFEIEKKDDEFCIELEMGWEISISHNNFFNPTATVPCSYIQDFFFFL